LGWFPGQGIFNPKNPLPALKVCLGGNQTSPIKEGTFFERRIGPLKGKESKEEFGLTPVIIKLEAPNYLGK